MKILNPNNMDEAINAIKDNKLVIFPTETVYGLGANALSKIAVENIFKAKGRPSNNPLIVHLSSKDNISKYAFVKNEVEKMLIDSFMPGPFTLILKKKDCIPLEVTGGLDTVGIRIPDNEIARCFINKCSVPIAAPSANLSTRPSGTKVSDIFDEFSKEVSYIIDGGMSRVGIESTVVKVIDNVPTILRPGFITKEDIINVCGSCNVINDVLESPKCDKVESPGLLYKHYAPKGDCILVYNEDIHKLKKLIEERIIDKTIIIGSSKLKDISCYKFLYYGDNLVDIAKNIFTLLRKADTYNPSLIIIEGMKKEGFGLGIMNRLLRSSSFNYFE